MLVEYGGKVNLNPAWAKSFLKRLNAGKSGGEQKSGRAELEEEES